jgi:hypothetical protein
MEETIESSPLLRSLAPTSASSYITTAALLRRVVITTRGVISCLLLICDIMYLGLGAVLPS